MLKERLLSLIINMDKLTKTKIKDELKTLILLKEIVDDEDVMMFNNANISGICCLPSICLRNTCEIDANVEL